MVLRSVDEVSMESDARTSCRRKDFDQLKVFLDASTRELDKDDSSQRSTSEEN